jgi:hypothetical protein
MGLRGRYLGAYYWRRRVSNLPQRPVLGMDDFVRTPLESTIGPALNGGVLALQMSAIRQEPYVAFGR